MKLYLSTIFLCFIVSISCKNSRVYKNQIKYVKNIETINLEGQSINIKNIFEPNSIVIKDSFLIILDSKSEYCFHIFNANTFKPVAQFGRKGRGPDEFMDPVIINEVVNTYSPERYISVFDRVRRRLSYIYLSELLGTFDYKIKSELLPTEMLKVSNIIFKNDSTALYIPHEEGNPGRFSIYNFKNESLVYTPYLPTLGFKVHQNNLYPIYATSSFCTNKSKNKFVAIPALLGELDFYTLSGKYIHTTVIERRQEIRNAKNAELLFNIPGVYYYFSNLVSVDDQIYALILRKEYPEFSSVSNSNIYVFDWDGNPLVCFSLDREISHMAYDPNSKSFIAYSPKDVDLPFIKYDVK